MEQVLRNDTDGQIYLHRAQNFSLERLQELVGGYIETVHLVELVSPYIMIVDDEGRLKNKPLNPLASVLYSGIIAGDAVIMAEGVNSDGEHDLVGLTTEQARVASGYMLRIAELVWDKRKSPDTAATESER